MARNQVKRIKATLDISELVSFGKNITDKSLRNGWEQIAEDVARVVLAEVKRNTPVVTEELRKHWEIDNKTLEVRKVKGGYSVVLKNNARNEKGYAYGTDVEYGHPSHNQFNAKGTPYVVYNSKYGKNGGDVIGLFLIPKAVANSERKMRGAVAPILQQWLDRCVTNGK